MLKKISILSLSVLFLSSCTTLSNIPTYKTSNTPRYKISDEDTKQWIIKGNKVEQCLFPNEYKNGSFRKLSQEKRYLHTQFVYENTLPKIIGISNTNIIKSDRLSNLYLGKQYQKFNHSRKVSFDKSWCNSLKKEYRLALKNVKEQIKRQVAIQKAQREQAEKERIARQKFYASPQGQAYLMQQQLLQQQQVLINQQNMMQQRAIQDAASSISGSIDSLNNSINRPRFCNSFGTFTQCY